MPDHEHLAGRRRTANEALEELAVGLPREGLVRFGQRDPAQVIDLAAWGEAAAGGLHRPPSHHLGAQESRLLLEVAGLAERATKSNPIARLFEDLANGAVDLR